MARDQRGAVLRHVQTLFHLGTVSGLSDAQLLEHFTARTDPSAELAFSVLVERHGPMVLRVCRSVLRDVDDAHDSFQATFLVLARQARAIRRKESVASWLHGVALRVSSRARSTAARQRRLERRAAERIGTITEDQPPRDWEAVLQEEIDRLPEPFRAPIVLCDLEGLTHEQAAGKLGCPVGTVKSRQARGRARLRSRLDRRGLAPMIATTPALSPALMDLTVRAAVRNAAGKAVATETVSATVAALIEGTLTTMIETKLKIAALFVLSASVVAAGAGILAGQPVTSDPLKATAPSQDVGKAPNALDPAEPPRLTRLASEQAARERLLQAARQRLEAQTAFYEENRITVDRYLDASEQVRHAESGLSETREGRMAAAQANLDRIKAIETRERKQLEEGRGTVADVAEVTQRRLQAEIDVLDAKNLNTRPEDINDLTRRLRAVEVKLDRVLKELEEQKKKTTAGRWPNGWTPALLKELEEQKKKTTGGTPSADLRPAPRR